MTTLNDTQERFVIKYLRARGAPAGETESREAEERETGGDPPKSTTQAAVPASDTTSKDKLLKDALSHGPLSGKGLTSFAPEVQKKFVAAYDIDPGLAQAAVNAASGSGNPAALAIAVEDIAKRMKDGFKDKEGKPLPPSIDPRTYAEGLIRMGAHCGPDYFARLGDYIDSGAGRSPGALGDGDSDKPAERVKNRATALAQGLLGSDGTFPLDKAGVPDLSTPEAKAAIGNLLFHPDALKAPTPTLNAQVLKRVAFFTDPETGPKAAGILSNMSAPESGKAAAKIVSDAVGGTTVKDARTSVMSSMLKSFDQGPVGSCFATAPCRKMLETEPLVAMGKLSEIASKGTLTPHDGIASPVVTNIPPGDDTLLRAMEYTYATSMARDQNNSVVKSLDGGNFLAMLKVRDDICTLAGSKSKYDALDEMREAMRDDFIMEYDPGIETQRADDQKSSKGRFVIRSKTTGEQITTKEQYADVTTKLVLKALKVDPTSEAATKIKQKIESDDFLGELAKKKEPPWMLASGGKTHESVQTIYGPIDDTPSTAENTTKSDTPEKAGARTAKVVGDLLGKIGGMSEEMVVVRTTGIHAFNALPGHESLKPLTSGPKSAEETLKDIAENAAKKSFDPDLAAWHFDQQMAPEIARYQGYLEKAQEAKKEDDIAWYEKRLKAITEGSARARPDTAMTAKEISAALNSVLKDFGGDADQIDKKLSAGMVADVGVPQFVIADANWGSGSDHTFFVVAPDPVSGQPMMFERTDPPGSLVPMDPKWIDAEWAPVVPKTEAQKPAAKPEPPKTASTSEPPPDPPKPSSTDEPALAKSDTNKGN